MPSVSNKATDAAAERLRRIHRGNHRGHHLERTLFGMMLSCLALLLAATGPRSSSADVLTTKIMNPRKTGGVASPAGGGGRPFELLLPKEQLDKGDVDVDVDSNHDNTFKFDIDGDIDDEEGNSGLSFELLLRGEQLDKGDVDVDVDSNRGNTFEFDVDGYIDDDEEGNSGLFNKYKKSDAEEEEVGVVVLDEDDDEEESMGGGVEGGVKAVAVKGGFDSSAAADKNSVKSLGAGPLLPVRGAIVGIFEKASMPFTKLLKQSKPKRLDALQPSSTVDDRIVLHLHGVREDYNDKDKAKTTAWGDDADTLLDDEEEGRAHVMIEGIKARTQDTIEVVKVWGGVDSSTATTGLVSADDDDNDGGLELDGQNGEGGVMYSLGRGFAHEEQSKKTGKSLGAGPLLPVRGILATFKKALLSKEEQFKRIAAQPGALDDGDASPLSAMKQGGSDQLEVALHTVHLTLEQDRMRVVQDSLEEENGEAGPCITAKVEEDVFADTLETAVETGGSQAVVGREGMMDGLVEGRTKEAETKGFASIINICLFFLTIILQFQRSSKAPMSVIKSWIHSMQRPKKRYVALRSMMPLICFIYLSVAKGVNEAQFHPPLRGKSEVSSKSGSDPLNLKKAEKQVLKDENKVRTSDQPFTVASLGSDAFRAAFAELGETILSEAIDKVYDAVDDLGGFSQASELAERFTWAEFAEDAFQEISKLTEDEGALDSFIGYLVEEAVERGGAVAQTVAGSGVCGQEPLYKEQDQQTTDSSLSHPGRAVFQTIFDAIDDLIIGDAPSLVDVRDRRILEERNETRTQEIREATRERALRKQEERRNAMIEQENNGAFDVSSQGRNLEPDCSDTCGLYDWDSAFGASLTVTLGLTVDVLEFLRIDTRVNAEVGFGIGLEMGFSEQGVISGFEFGGSFALGYTRKRAGYAHYDKVENGNRVTREEPCPEGRYCPADTIFETQAALNEFINGSAQGLQQKPTLFCKSGHFCPQKSTHETGKPAVASTTQGAECESGKVCKCKEKYFCPKGSTTATGKPLEDYDSGTTISPSQRFTCLEGSECKCFNVGFEGYACPEGSPFPSLCKQGSYCDGSGAGEGQPCSDGYFCPKGSKSQEGITVADGSGDIVDTSINPEKRHPCAQADKCPCPEDYYCSAANKDGVPKLCSKAGFYCPKMSTAEDGLPSSSSNRDFQVTLPADPSQQTTVPVACPASTQCKCPERFYCGDSSSSFFTSGKKPNKPEPCEEGFYCEEGTEKQTRTKCKKGYYCLKFSIETDKKKCPKNHYCGEGLGLKPTGSTNLCEDEYYCPETSTTNHGNPDEPFSDSVSNTVVCAKTVDCRCTENFYCKNIGNEGDSDLNRSPCPEAKYCPAGTADPQPCPAGKFCEEGKEPKPCPNFKYCPLGDPLSPKDCKSDGSEFCPEGSSEPKPCPKGYTCPVPNTITPTDVASKDPCPEGKFCEEGSAPQDCLLGYFCPPTSSSKFGAPVEAYTHPATQGGCTNCNCGIGQECLCAAGYTCPDKKTPDETPCPVNHYCEKGTSVETPCPPGKLCEETKIGSLDDAVNCPAGFACPGGGQPEQPCEDGYYCPETSKTVQGHPLSPYKPAGKEYSCGNDGTGICQCPEKYYCDDKKVPKPCTKGNFCGPGVSEQTPCPAGKFCDDKTGISLSPSVPCTEGYMCPESAGSSTAQPCPPKFFCPAGTKSEATCSSTAPDCPKDCLPRTYCEGQNSIGKPCTAGHYCPGGTDKMLPCPGGRYCSSDESKDTGTGPCGAKYYCPVSSMSPQGRPRTGKDGCFASHDCNCKPGYQCLSGSENGKDDPCPPGSYCIDGIKNDCERGFYCPESSQTSKGNPDIPPQNDPCTAECYCPQGYFCPGGTAFGTQHPCSDPSKCGLGSPCDFSVNDQCDSSKSRLVIKSPNLLQFTKTLAIEMQLAETQESCTHAGFFCMYDRALLCPRGFYCPLGQSKRSKCLPGFYCPGGSTAGDGRPIRDEDEDDGCRAGEPCVCPAGRYCAAGSYSRLGSGPCEAGRYCEEGAKTPSGHGLCAGGYFCNPGSTSPKGHGPCSAGSYCPAGSYAPTMFICPAGSFCLEGVDAPMGRGAGKCAPGFYCPQGSKSFNGQGPCFDGYDCEEGGASSPYGKGRLQALTEIADTGNEEAEPIRYDNSSSELLVVIARGNGTDVDHKKSVGRKQLPVPAPIALATPTAITTPTAPTSAALHAPMTPLPTTAPTTTAPTAQSGLEALGNAFKDAFELGVEVAIYPNVNELMGWGGFDIELDFSGLGWIVQSIILKFGLDYYSCKQACTGNAVLTSEECGPAYGFGFEGIAVKFVSVDSDTFSSGSLVQAITDEWKNIFRGNPDSPDQQFSVGVAFMFGSGLWRSNDGPNFDQCAGKSFNPTDSVNCQPWNKGNKNLDVCCDETCPTDTSTDAPSSSPTSGPSKSPTTSPSKAPTSSPSKSPTAGPTAGPIVSSSLELHGLRGKNSIPEERRMLQNFSSNKAAKILQQGIDVLEIGEVIVPLCIGLCDDTDDIANVDKRLVGEITANVASTCDAVAITGTVLESITLKKVAYVALHGIDSQLATLVSGAFGLFGNVGIQNGAMVQLQLGPGTSLEFRAAGSPQLVSNVDEGDDAAVFDILREAQSLFDFELNAKLDGLSVYEVELRVIMPPKQVITDSNGNGIFWIRSPDGTRGASLFQKMRVDDFASPAPVYTQSFGLDIEVTVCTTSCHGDYSSAEYLYFLGQVSTETVATPVTPPTGRLGGRLELTGTARQFFGIPFLHIDYLLMGATFSYTTFPFPDSFVLGGSGCIGSESACFDTPSTGTSIEADLYVGIDTIDPNQNFFYASFTEVTFGTVLNILAENIDDKFYDVLANIPEQLLVSGIRPRKSADDPACLGYQSAATSVDEQVQDEVSSLDTESGMDRDCRAYISVAPFSQVEVNGLTIPQGIGFGGIINIADVVVIDAELQIDIFSPGTKRLFADIEIAPINIGNGAIQILGLNGNPGPRFVLDLDTAGSVYVSISGRVDLDIIMSEAEIEVLINDQGGLIDGSMSLFGGLMGSTDVYILWHWDGSLLDCRLNNWELSPLFVFNNMRVYTENYNIVEFEMDVTVLMFADFYAYLSIQRDGTLFSFDFTVTADFELVETTLTGSVRNVDPANGFLTEDSFGDLSVTLRPGGFVKDVGQAIEDGAKAIAEGVTNLANQAVAFVDQIVGVVRDVWTSTLNDMRERLKEGGKDVLRDIDNIKDSVSNLFNGNGGNIEDVMSSVKDLGNTLLNVVEDVVGIFWDGVKDLGTAFLNGIAADSEVLWTRTDTLAEKDEWGCNYKRTAARVKLCYGVCGFSATRKVTKYGEKFEDETCVEVKKNAYDDVESKSAEIENVGEETSKNQNDNRAALEYDASQQDVSFGQDAFNFAVPADSSRRRRLQSNPFMIQTPINFKTLSNVNGGQSSELTPDQVNFEQSIRFEGDTFSEDMASMRAAMCTTAASVALQDMPGKSTRLNGLLGNEPLPAPALPVVELKTSDGRNANDPIILSCANSIDGARDQVNIISVDSNCKSPPPSIRRKPGPDVTRMSTDPNDLCGTSFLDRTYEIKDGCGQKVFITQYFKINPVAPTWDASTLVYDRTFSIGDDDLCEEDELYEPDENHACHYPTKIERQDSALQAVENGCGGWEFQRTFTASLDFNNDDDSGAENDYCAANFQVNPSVTFTQSFHITPQPPVFVSSVPDVAIVPFFDNNVPSIPSVPVVSAPTPGCGFEDLGISSVQNSAVLLQSNDAPLRISPGFMGTSDEELTCRIDGLASFERTWTAGDSCGVTTTLLQKVIVEHPPSSLLPARLSYVEGWYDRSVDVEQQNLSCEPSKAISLGHKYYYDSQTCDNGEWTMDGCRKDVALSVDQPTVELLASKPTFAEFPSTAFITTAESPLPNNTGWAIGKGYCDVPVTVDYEDEPPVLVSCGVWNITRVWTVRNAYLDCPDTVARDELILQRLQTIVVEDIFAPEWVELPDQDTSVPFLSDYGSNVTGVPAVEDIATDPDISLLGLVSYPITLEYSDKVQFHLEPELSCDQGLAVVQRTWATNDRCNNSDTWVQIVRVSHPRASKVPESDGYFSTASGFQLYSGADAEIRNTDIDGAIAVGGNSSGLTISHIAPFLTADVEMSVDRIMLEKNGTRSPSPAPSMLPSPAPSEEIPKSGKFQALRVGAGDPTDKTCGNGEPTMLTEICPHLLGGGKEQKGNVVFGSLEYGEDEDHECNMSNVIVEGKELKAGNLHDTFKQGNAGTAAAGLSISRLDTNLRTGPQMIVCESRLSCTTKLKSTWAPTTVSIDHDDATSFSAMTLTGNNDLYNIFEVDAQDWLANDNTNNKLKDASLDVPTLIVDSTGFVVVNVIDRLVLDQRGCVETSRGIEPKQTGRKKGTCPFPKWPRHEHEYNDVPRNVILTSNTLGDEYLLFNLATRTEDNTNGMYTPDDIQKLESAKWTMRRADDRYFKPSVFRGTVVVGNPLSQMEVRDMNWDGGQLLGHTSRIFSSSFHCGLFAANTLCPRL